MSERQKLVCELADLYRRLQWASLYEERPTTPEIRLAYDQAMASKGRVAELEALLGLTEGSHV